MKTSIRKFRESMKAVFSAVKHGEEVIVYSRNHPIAKIIPVKETLAKPMEDEAFGMWKDHPSMKNINQYLRDLRKGRQHDL